MRFGDRAVGAVRVVATVGVVADGRAVGVVVTGVTGGRLGRS